MDEPIQAADEAVVAPTTEAVQETPTNSEVAPEAPAPETPVDTEELKVPKSRFDEVYAEAKSNKRELDEVKAALEQIKSQTTAEPVNEGPDLEPEAQAAIEKLLKAKGLMTRAEFEEAQSVERAASQLQTDVRELSGWAEKEGYPKFEVGKVQEWAKENNVSITSKSSLKAAYLAQNQEAIIAAAIKRGVSASEAPKATVEKPGAGTGKAPSEPAKGPMTIQERIRAAMPTNI